MPDTNYYEGRCGKVRKKDRTRGHEKLMEHLTRNHKTFWSNISEKTTTLFPLLTRRKIPRKLKQFTVS